MRVSGPVDGGTTRSHPGDGGQLTAAELVLEALEVLESDVLDSLDVESLDADFSVDELVELSPDLSVLLLEPLLDARESFR
jgi:hypothetical protein